MNKENACRILEGFPPWNNADAECRAAFINVIRIVPIHETALKQVFIWYKQGWEKRGSNKWL